MSRHQTLEFEILTLLQARANEGTLEQPLGRLRWCVLRRAGTCEHAGDNAARLNPRSQWVRSDLSPGILVWSSNDVLAFPRRVTPRRAGTTGTRADRANASVGELADRNIMPRLPLACIDLGIVEE